LELIESAKDKRRLNNTKSDPSKALNEATPAEQAQEESTVDDIRLVRYKDTEGNIISDPDRSNPTRARLERPLDTIRSFAAAAEGTSSRRSSYTDRPGSQIGFNGDMNRRSSYYSNNGFSPQRQRPTPGAGYYRNSSYGFGPQTVEEAPGAAQMYARNTRQMSHPHFGQQHNGNPIGPPNGLGGQIPNDSPMSAHSYQQSYETMTSGSEDYGKSTGPSSQNSSYDRLHQLRKPDDYPADNPYANDMMVNNGSTNRSFPSPYGVENHYGQDMTSGPAPPVQYPVNNPRKPIKLDSSPSDVPFNTNTVTSPSTKKKSWLGRRFSRREN
jgi:hypothetical protein